MYHDVFHNTVCMGRGAWCRAGEPEGIGSGYILKLMTKALLGLTLVRLL